MTKPNDTKSSLFAGGQLLPETSPGEYQKAAREDLDVTFDDARIADMRTQAVARAEAGLADWERRIPSTIPATRTWRVTCAHSSSAFVAYAGWSRRQVIATARMAWEREHRMKLQDDAELDVREGGTMSNLGDIDTPRPFAVTRILSALALLIERDPALSRAAEVLADALELAAGTKRKGYVRVAICEDCMELADPHRGRIAHAANCPSKLIERLAVELHDRVKKAEAGRERFREVVEAKLTLKEAAEMMGAPRKPQTIAEATLAQHRGLSQDVEPLEIAAAMCGRRGAPKVPGFYQGLDVSTSGPITFPVVGVQPVALRPSDDDPRDRAELLEELLAARLGSGNPSAPFDLATLRVPTSETDGTVVLIAEDGRLVITDDVGNNVGVAQLPPTSARLLARMLMQSADAEEAKGASPQAYEPDSEDGS